MEKSNPTPAPEPFVMTRQIGSTTFLVNIFFDQNAKETLDEKVKRLMKNDLQSYPHDAKINSLQADWLPKGVHNEH